MRGIVGRIKSEVKRSREQRRMLRDFYAASPRMQEELSVVLRRNH